MTKFVPIEDIHIKRTVGSPEPDPVVVADLAVSINDTGLKVPVLLDDDLNLIDGLSRIRAHQLLSRDTVEATIVSTFDDAMAALKVTHKGPPPDRRVAEIYMSVRPLMERRLIDMRARLAHVTLSGRKAPKAMEEASTLAAQSLGVRSKGLLEACDRVYRYAEQQDPVGEFARSVVRLLETEEGWTAYRALGMIKRFISEQDLLTDPTEQRQVIQAALMRLGGLAKGIKDLGELSEKITVEEARAWKEEYVKAHREMFRLSMRLSERIRRD